MVYTPTIADLAAPRHAPGNDRVPATSGAPQRTYEVAALRPDASVTRRRITAPAAPAFEAAFSAIARGTLVATTRGPVAVEDLTPGMKLLTEERGPSPLLWIGAMTLPPRPADHGGGAAPRLVRVMADAFGMGRPMPDMLGGAGARLLQRKAGRADMVLTPLTDLVDGNGVIPVNPPSAVTLYHLGLRRHATITAAGLSIETFHPGPGFDRAMNTEALGRFMSLFPHLRRPAEFGALAHVREPLGIASDRPDVA